MSVVMTVIGIHSAVDRTGLATLTRYIPFGRLTFVTFSSRHFTFIFAVYITVLFTGICSFCPFANITFGCRYAISLDFIAFEAFFPIDIGACSGTVSFIEPIVASCACCYLDTCLITALAPQNAYTLGVCRHTSRRFVSVEAGLTEL